MPKSPEGGYVPSPEEEQKAYEAMTPEQKRSTAERLTATKQYEKAVIKDYRHAFRIGKEVSDKEVLEMAKEELRQQWLGGSKEEKVKNELEYLKDQILQGVEIQYEGPPRQKETKEDIYRHFGDILFGEHVKLLEEIYGEKLTDKEKEDLRSREYNEKAMRHMVDNIWAQGGGLGWEYWEEEKIREEASEFWS